MKEGARVKLIGGNVNDKYNPKELEGTIVSINGKMNPIIVLWDNNVRNSYHERNLQLVK